MIGLGGRGSAARTSVPRAAAPPPRMRVTTDHEPLLEHPIDRWVLALYLLSVVGVVIQQSFTHVDYNFAIFAQSFRHLVAGRDLYAAYPAEQVDLFKYSPTFALLFAPFALLPTLAGLALWNFVNVGALWYAVRRLLPAREANVALVLMFMEVLRTTQRAQSNALVAALMVLAFVWLERRQQLGAAMAVALGAAIKLFPILAIAPAIFHPRKVRMAASAVAAGGAVVLLPLLVTPARTLLAQYTSWRALERLDALAGATGGGAGLYGGVMHWVRLALHVDWPNWPIQLAGLALLLLPLLRVAQWDVPEFRLRLLASILIFSTIFNHQVESPSFVIAMVGVSIWFVLSARRTLDVALLAAVLLVVSIGSSDAVPRALRVLIVDYKLKTLPCLAVWITLQCELLAVRRAQSRGRGDAAAAPVT